MENSAQQTDNDHHMQCLDFSNGEVKSFFSLPKNQICTRDQSAEYSALIGILSIFVQFPTICLLLTIIYLAIFDLDLPFLLPMYAIQLGLIIIVNIIKNIIINRSKASADASINQRKAKVFRGSEQYEEMPWGQIRQGDIVYLQQGETAPADLLLLDSQLIHLRQAITHVDIKNVSGNLEPQKKRACYLTQILNRNGSLKLFWHRYRSIISGRINFEKATADMRTFRGYLKVSKDPKMQKLSIENLILRQSVIKTSLWVYGLAIYPGMESKIMKNFKQGNKNREAFFTVIDKIYLACLAVNIIIGAIFSVTYHFIGEELSIQHFAIAYHFLIFSILLPNMVYVGRDLFQIMFSLNSINKQVQVRNYSNLQSLGGISLAMISNIGVLNTGKLYVNQIVTESSIYELRDEEGPELKNIQEIMKKDKKSVQTKRRYGSSIREEQFFSAQNKNLLVPICNYDRKNSALLYKQNKNDYNEDANYQIDDDTSMRVRESPKNIRPSKVNTHLEPLKLNKQRFHNDTKRGQKQVIQFLKAISLCHQAKFYYNTTKSIYQGLTPVASEQILLQLLKFVGWSIQPITSNKVEIGLSISEQKQKVNEETGVLVSERGKKSYAWIGINLFHSSRKFFSVVIMEDEGEKVTMYCKGTPDAMIERLKISKETQKIIESTISTYRGKKSEIIIYAKRQFSAEERELYENDYISLKSSLTVTEEQIDAFSKKYESDLEFISIVGMSTRINPQAQPMMNQLTNSAIKPCIFARDNANIPNLMKLIAGKKSTWKEIRLEHESIEQIKYYLNEVTNQLHINPQLVYYVIVKDSAWRTIRNNSQLMQHFLFIFYYSKGLLAIQFSPQESAELTKNVRHRYPEEQKTIGIGSCFTDLKFLGESNISIGMESDLPTDLKASDLNKITEAIDLGPYFMETRLANINLIFYKIVILGTIILVYEILCNINKTSNTLDGCVVFFYLVILTCVDLGYYLFHFMTPKLESLHSYKNCQKNTASIKYTFIEAFIHGLFVIIPVYFGLPDVRLASGKILPAQALDMAIFIIIVFIHVTRNAFSPYYTKLSAALMGIISLFAMVLCCTITSFASISFYRIAVQSVYLFSAYDSIVLMLNVSIFCLVFSLFLQDIVKKNEELKAKNSCQKSDRAQKLLDMTELIKHLYKDEESIEESMREIVQKDINVNVNEMKIKTTLAIKNQEDDIKFDYHRVPKSKFMFLKVMILQLLLQLAVLIIDSTLSNQGFEAYKANLIAAIVVTTFAALVSAKCQMKLCYFKITAIIVFINSCLILGYSLTKNDYSSYILICFLSVAMTQSVGLKFPLLVSLLSLICIVTIILSFLLTQNYLQTSIKAVFLIGCYTINLVVIYKSELDSKINFIINETFEKQANYVNDILSILVPKFIKNHLEQNKFALQQQQTKVSILFCYVCNFDEIVKQEGKNVVPLMDQLFRQFDQLCHNYAVQKIETVGQTYMASTGIQPYEEQIETQMKKKNQVERLLKMAIQMREKSQAIMWGTKKNKKLKIKIGIHHGNVVIGVIGYHKPQFSLIGDTVNTTSRHCSTAQPDQIILSEMAFKQLKKYGLSAFEKKTRNMKGLGAVSVYAYKNAQMRHHVANNKARARFQDAVNKVIKKLRQQGVLKPRNYKAIELAKHFVQVRRNSRKVTKISEGRKSMEKDDVVMEDKDQIEGKENKYLDLELKYNWILELTEKNQEMCKYLIMKNAKKDRIYLGVGGALYLVLYLLYAITGKYTIVTIILMSLGIIIIPILIAMYKKALKSKIINVIYSILHFVLVLCVYSREIIVEKQLNDTEFISLVYLWVIIEVTICSSQAAFRFIHTVIFCFLCLVLNCVLCGVRESFDLALIVEFFYFLLICLRKYSNLEETYKNYSSSRIHKKKSKQQSDLVSQLLPKHAYEKLKNQNSQNRLELTDRFEKVTMLFADIKGFTSYSNRSTPTGVVKMLRLLFEEFDKLCLKYNVYKVYTIGDCYVVLGFTNCYQRNIYEEAKNVVNMGLAMIQSIQKVRESLNFSELDMRIGIHTGTIIGGIIGTEIVRYDIYGPDVMVANKFEEYGKTGAIHISESTKEILQRDNKCYTITPEKTVKVEKLNEEYNGYILCKKKFEI